MIWAVVSRTPGAPIQGVPTVPEAGIDSCARMARPLKTSAIRICETLREVAVSLLNNISWGVISGRGNSCYDTAYPGPSQIVAGNAALDAHYRASQGIDRAHGRKER